MRDHPRIRGEHIWKPIFSKIVKGIIPAYAGSTDALLPSLVTVLGSSPHTRGAPATGMLVSYKCRDHPRIRGEHPLRKAVHVERQGIIPAYAGST